MAQLVEQQSSDLECVQQLVLTPVAKLDETATVDIIDVDRSDRPVAENPSSNGVKLSDKPDNTLKLTSQCRVNDVCDEQLIKKVFIRRRLRPPDLPKKKGHKTIQISLSKSCISNVSVKSFKPTISLQKLFAGTSPRLIVKDNELQPAVALTEQYNILPRQHPVHNWTNGIKRHKFKIYTK